MTDQLSPADFPPNPLEKPGYRLEFHDEFDGSSLAAEQWYPYYLPHWSSKARTAVNDTFEDGHLVLQISQDQPPWCPEFDGEVRASVLQTGEFAGSVGSKFGQLRFSDALVVREAQENARLYTPQYGFFELRAKGLSTGANHVSLWMIGYEESPEQSGEIANFELVGAQAGAASSGVRFGVHPWGDPNLKEEFYEETFSIDTTRFHIYAVEWTPTHIDYYIDNLLIKTIYQSPNYPMQFMLGIYEHPFVGAWTGVYDPKAPYPKKFTVDYFRAYQPLRAYQPRGAERA